MKGLVNFDNLPEWLLRIVRVWFAPVDRIGSSPAIAWINPIVKNKVPASG